jgi:hypothetical protein
MDAIPGGFRRRPRKFDPRQLLAEARPAPAITGALCSAFDSLRDDVGPAGSNKRQHKVNDLRLPLRSCCEAQFLEQL